jgi:molecular chaperone GrpE
MQEASDEYESGTVTRELQKGYMLGDRVIRPSLVYVAE